MLVASAVVAVSLVAGAASILESSELGRSNGQYRAAAPIVASLLDEVRATPFDAVPATWSGTTRTVAGMPDATNGASATWEVIDVAGADPRWPVRLVRVHLAWDGAGGPQTFAASTYVADRSGTAPPPLTAVPPGSAIGGGE